MHTPCQFRCLDSTEGKSYLNLMADKRDGKHVNTKDIKKHRSDILKNVVIMTEDNIEAPASIVACIREFVAPSEPTGQLSQNHCQSHSVKTRHL